VCGVSEGGEEGVRTVGGWEVWPDLYCIADQSMGCERCFYYTSKVE